MPHDKIKAAARKRRTTTGEPYVAARRQAISEYNAATFTSPVSAEDVHAAALAHQELGPDYSDAVVASFIEKVDRAVAARVEARLADPALSKPAKTTSRGLRLTRRVARDVLAASAGALIAVGAIGLHGLNGAHVGRPVSSLPTARLRAERAAAARVLLLRDPALDVRRIRVTVLLHGARIVTVPAESVHR